MYVNDVLPARFDEQYTVAVAGRRTGKSTWLVDVGRTAGPPTVCYVSPVFDLQRATQKNFNPAYRCTTFRPYFFCDANDDVVCPYNLLLIDEPDLGPYRDRLRHELSVWLADGRRAAIAFTPSTSVFHDLWLNAPLKARVPQTTTVEWDKLLRREHYLSEIEALFPNEIKARIKEESTDGWHIITNWRNYGYQFTSAGESTADRTRRTGRVLCRWSTRPARNGPRKTAVGHGAGHRRGSPR